MEDVKHDCQSPSDWGSMKDLTSWGLSYPKKGQGFAQNYTGWPEKSRFQGYWWESSKTSWFEIIHGTEGSPA